VVVVLGAWVGRGGRGMEIWFVGSWLVGSAGAGVEYTTSCSVSEKPISKSASDAAAIRSSCVGVR